MLVEKLKFYFGLSSNIYQFPSYYFTNNGWMFICVVHKDLFFYFKLLSHHYPSYGWFCLSTWWDLESPWKQISEHVRGISSIRVIDVGRTSSLPGVLNWIKRRKWSDISEYCSLWMQCDQMSQSATSMTFLPRRVDCTFKMRAQTSHPEVVSVFCVSMFLSWQQGK